ncbi:MAG: NUDIX domain-containing protein [Litoreibacter sp.]
MNNIFLYGSLLDAELLEIVLGRAANPVSARLDGFWARWVDQRDFPMIEAQEGRFVDGLLLEGLDEDELALLDFYEAPFAYDLREVSVQTSKGVKTAQTYMPNLAKGYKLGAQWNVEEWTARFGALRKFAAIEIMSRFGTLSAQEITGRMPVILARAQQRLDAQNHSSAQNLRVNMNVQGIEVKQQITEHDKWFLTEELFLTHPRFDGGQSPEMARSVFVMSDAVSVLPYDPKRDTVMLIEQFRAGCFRRGDPHPWSLEVIAGRIDGGETVEGAAKREALEETGLSVENLHRVSSYYSSPGATTEYLTSFVAIADLPKSAAGLGGLDTENEDIRAMVVPFQALMDAVADGEAENAPLLISALWLAANRDRLRASC